MNTECPWCNARAIDITTHDNDFDQRSSYMCAGPEGHRWRDGEGPEPEEEPQELMIILATR